MDLRITITDENGNTLQNIEIYEDGSDSDAVDIITMLIEEEFKSCSTFVSKRTKLEPTHGTRYGVMHSVGEWQQICRSLRKDGEGLYADSIEKNILSMQAEKLGSYLPKAL